MSSQDNRKDINPDDYRRAVVDAFLYYLSSHSRENSDLMKAGIKAGIKEWLEEQSSGQDHLIALHTGEVTEFHEVLEEIYTNVDKYGRACREYGKLRAASPTAFISDDSADVYEAEKQLKLKIEQIVNENIRLKRILESTGEISPAKPAGGSIHNMLRETVREWLSERKNDIIG